MKLLRNTAAGSRRRISSMRRQEPRAIAPAAHPPQQRLADVLQREIEVRHAGGADGVDQGIAEVAGVEIQEPHAVDPLGDGTHERHDRPGSERGRGVLAVRREVLRHQHHFAHTELVHLGEDRVE